MAYGTNPRQSYSYGHVDRENKKQFQHALGISSDRPTEPTIQSFRPIETKAQHTAELAEMGGAIQNSLSGTLDAALIEREVSELATCFERFPELRKMGTPEYGETPYQDLTTAAWRLVDHLKEVAFFEATEEHLPAFTADHITSTTKRLLQMDSLPDTLTTLGFSDHEQVALVTNIVNASEQLSWWDPTADYPSIDDVDDFDEGIKYQFIPPLHHRAMGGSLLWIDGLDWHLWQNEVLLTQPMIERGVWDVKSMLAGVYLLGDATRRLAEGTISDESLTTLATASTAIMIIGQEFLVDDIARITDEERKPRNSSRRRD